MSRDMFKEAALAGTSLQAGGSVETLEVHRKALEKCGPQKKGKSKKAAKAGEYSPEFEAAVEEAICELERETGQGEPTFKDTFLFTIWGAMTAKPAEEEPEKKKK
mmetsp:Transcript_19495/g.58960  ORF Transcript_19495/g.58960 Transcript_19495/m.58960 type:complete len:105 (-) Transcript_19495:1558-1872(-)